MGELTANVNWLAVIAGAMLAFLLGWLWYSPWLFGAKWAEGVGVKMGAATAMPVAPMVAQAIATLFLSWVVGVTAAANALATIILVAVTIALLIAAGGLFAGKSRYAIYAEAGFVLAMVLVMIVIQGIL